MGGVSPLIALLALSGCGQISSKSDSVLPIQLSMLVYLTSGEPLSVVVDLRRNTRHQLDVRVSRGHRFFDGEHLWEAWVLQSDGAYTLRFNELLSGSHRELPMRTVLPPQILAIDRNEVWVGQADRRPDSVGVMLDDLWAGFYAGVGVMVLGALWHIPLILLS